MDRTHWNLTEGASKLGPSIKDTGAVGRRFPDVGPILSGYSAVHLDLWRVDLGGDPFNWKGTGGLPSQGGVEYFREATYQTVLHDMVLPPPSWRRPYGQRS